MSIIYRPSSLKRSLGSTLYWEDNVSGLFVMMSNDEHIKLEELTYTAVELLVGVVAGG